MADPSAAAAPKFVLDNTLGAMYIGVILAGILFGVSCLQMWHYFNAFGGKDPWYLKLLVGAVWISDSTHQALVTHTLYFYLISNYANPVALTDIVWSLVAEVLFNGFTALLVQGFFAYRIWRLSHKHIFLTSFVVIMVIGNFIVLLTYTIKAWQLPDLQHLPEIKGLSMSINACGAATDVVIAASMCWLLHGARSGFKRTDNAINRLMIFIVNTGLLTSICALASLISIIAWPNAYIYICFFFIVGRMYNNSLLAALNSRSGGSLSSQNDRSRNQSHVTDQSFDQLSRSGRVANTLPLNNMKGSYNPTAQTNGQEITITINKQTNYDELSTNSTRFGDVKHEV